MNMSFGDLGIFDPLNICHLNWKLNSLQLFDFQSYTGHQNTHHISLMILPRSSQLSALIFSHLHIDTADDKDTAELSAHTQHIWSDSNLKVQGNHSFLK